MKSESIYREYKATMVERMLWKIFPSKHLAITDGHFKCVVNIRLDWKDRLRILFSGRARCEVVIHRETSRAVQSMFETEPLAIPAMLKGDANV